MGLRSDMERAGLSLDVPRAAALSGVRIREVAREEEVCTSGVGSSRIERLIGYVLSRRPVAAAWRMAARRSVRFLTRLHASQHTKNRVRKRSFLAVGRFTDSPGKPL